MLWLIIVSLFFGEIERFNFYIIIFALVGKKKKILVDICGVGCEDYVMDLDYNYFLFIYLYKRLFECYIVFFFLRCCNFIF